MQQTIPVIDLALLRGREEAALVEAMGAAFRDIGFVAVENHGVDPTLIREAYAQARAFFELPLVTRLRYEDLALKGQRGYTSFGREHAKDHPAPDLKEFWHVGRELPPGHPLAGEYPANLWPEEAPGFRSVFLELYAQMERCAMGLLELVSLALGEPRDVIRDTAVDGNTILRIIHYPPVPADASPASIRAAPHEDINLITLLCESTDEGLELQRRDGAWLPIRAIPGQIIADAGDMLQNLTNGVVPSTTHRVVNPPDSRSRRFSMPFFVHPRSEVSLDPLPGCVRRVGEQRFPDITAGEYLAQRLREIGLT